MFPISIVYALEHSISQISSNICVKQTFLIDKNWEGQFKTHPQISFWIFFSLDSTNSMFASCVCGSRNVRSFTFIADVASTNPSVSQIHNINNVNNAVFFFFIRFIQFCCHASRSNDDRFCQTWDNFHKNLSDKCSVNIVIKAFSICIN